MKLYTKEVKAKTNIEVGDVVIFKKSGNSYLITIDKGLYTAKGFNGSSNASGHHDTLQSLIKSMDHQEYTHYSKHEYYFDLIKK